ncbi:MAG: DUF6429 family protein [Bacteroidota bacterium]
MKEQLKEMTLLMMYLQSWNEDLGDFSVKRAWKGYDFNILNELDAQGLIADSNKAKSATIRKELISTGS